MSVRPTYTRRMPSTFRPCNGALQQEELDGSLLYDFQGYDDGDAPSRARVGRQDRHPALVLLHPGVRPVVPTAWCTRSSGGQPRRACPGEAALRQPERLASGLKGLLDGGRRVAMEYSPANAIPYVSRVDAGTVEAVRALGAEVVSSGDLIQRFEAVWTDAAYATHLSASRQAVSGSEDQAFALIRERIRTATPTTEFEVQQRMVEWFKAEGLTSTIRRTYRPRRTPAILTTTLLASRAGRSTPASSS